MDHAINDIGLLALTAAVVAMIARRARVPYAVGLVVSGVVLAAAGYSPEIRLSPQLIYVLFLPPLVFEAALHIKWTELRRNLLVVATLATVGVVIAAGIITAGMHFVVGWPIAASVCFGTLIAATDPVSVIATFKEAGVRGRLALLVESESLLNDSTAAIIAALAVSFAVGASTTSGGVAVHVAISVGGGILAGGVVAWLAVLLAGRTSDHLVEVTITTIAAYGAFLAAERFHASGVLASLTAGLIVGNLGMRGAVSAAGRAAVIAFWEYAAFVVNSVIFLLIGIEITGEHISQLAITSAVAILLVLVSRAASIYPLSALFARTRLHVPMAYQHILVWGGLRGALALALALGLPASLPGREAVLTVTFAVTAFSIIVQGLTMPPLLRRLGAIGVPPAPDGAESEATAAKRHTSRES